MNRKDLELVDAAVKRIEKKFSTENVKGGRQDRPEQARAEQRELARQMELQAQALRENEPAPIREAIANHLSEHVRLMNMQEDNRRMTVPATMSGRLQIAADLAEAGMITYEDVPTLMEWNGNDED